MNEFQKKMHTQLILRSQLIMLHLEQERGEQLRSQNEVNVQVDHTMRRKLDRIAAALKRLEQGNFGKCLSCRQAIDEERLECNPEAELCIHCQRRIERKQIPSHSYAYA